MNVLATVESEVELRAVCDFKSLHSQIGAHEEPYSLNHNNVTMSKFIFIFLTEKYYISANTFVRFLNLQLGYHMVLVA